MYVRNVFLVTGKVCIWLKMVDPQLIYTLSLNRFYVDPSIALKNMPPQTPSGTSSTASTPNSDTPKPGPPAPSASVSRPSVPPSQVSLGGGTIQGGFCLNRLKVPYMSEVYEGTKCVWCLIGWQYSISS